MDKNSLIVYPDYIIVACNVITSNLVNEQDYHFDHINKELIIHAEIKIHLMVTNSDINVVINAHKTINVFKEFYNSKVTFNIAGNLNINSLIIPKTISNNEIIFNLLNYQTTLNVYDSALINKKHRYDEIVTINHKHTSSFSDYRFYGIAKDESFLGIKVTSVIETNMARSEAHQKIFVIISDKAKTSAHPNLVIDNFDVKASHANSIGQINPDQLYYLNSRGITKANASKLIIMGYFNPVLNTFPDVIREKIALLISES